MSGNGGGTRFLLYPQYASGYAEPELVTVSSPAGSLGPGPADRRMGAVLPVDKPAPYEPPLFMPPWRGPVLPPALPGPGGHFDTVPQDAPQFLAAHLFGCARFVLDVWEGYLGGEVEWWHAASRPRLELVPMLDWDNAHSGPGFIETGLRPNRFGRPQPFALNFDVVAHELGHAILFSEIGVPRPEAITPAYLALHESFSDLVALIAALHFDSVVDRLLGQTDGNLYVLNSVSRIGEISDLEEIRIADNAVRMEDVAGLRLGPDGTWVDPTGAGRNAHHLAQPLTGAIWDTLVELFQDGLAERGVIPPDLDTRGWDPREVQASLAHLQGASARALAAFGGAFRASLAEARDLVGACLAQAMRTTAPEGVSFGAVAARFIEAMLARGQGRNLEALLDDFDWRGIDARPALRAREGAAAAAAEERRRWARLPYGERARRVAAARGAARRRDAAHCGCDAAGAFFLARRMMPHAHRVLVAEAPARPLWQPPSE